MIREYDQYNDRDRTVETVDANDARKPRAVIRSRPMRADEIKSGEWVHPVPHIDEKGHAHDRITFHRSSTPGQYRRLCQSLIAKGFKPVSPAPLETTTLTLRK
jgi:hypothetical protein